jgi:hypothetical protein
MMSTMTPITVKVNANDFFIITIFLILCKDKEKYS